MSSSVYSHAQVDEQTFFVRQPAYRAGYGNSIERRKSGSVTRTQGSPSKLTRREIEVLQWSADGRTALEIAAILCLSQETVHSHVKNAVLKLQVTNKTAAVAEAIRTGIFC